MIQLNMAYHCMSFWNNFLRWSFIPRRMRLHQNIQTSNSPNQNTDILNGIKKDRDLIECLLAILLKKTVNDMFTSER